MPAIQNVPSRKPALEQKGGSNSKLADKFQKLNLARAKTNLKAPVEESLVTRILSVPEQYKPAQSRLIPDCEQLFTEKQKKDYYASDVFLSSYVPARLAQIQYAYFIKDIPWNKQASVDAEQALFQELKVKTTFDYKSSDAQAKFAKYFQSMEARYSISSSGSEFQSMTEVHRNRGFKRLPAIHIKTSSGRVFEVMDYISIETAKRLSRFMERPIDEGHNYLGRGRYSKVKYSYEPASKVYFAAKEMTSKDMALREAACHRMIRRDTALVTMVDCAHLYSDNVYQKSEIFFPIVKHGNLEEFIKINTHSFSMDKPENLLFMKKVIFSVIKSVVQLHQQNLCHRDLKLDNFLIETNNLLKPRLSLCDFGFAEPLDHSRMQYTFKYAGTVDYLPNNFMNNTYTGIGHDQSSLGLIILLMVKKIDINSVKKFDFSLGGVQFTVESSKEGLKHDIDRQKYKLRIDTYDSFEAIAAGLLDKNAATRLSGQDALKLAFFNDVRY